MDPVDHNINMALESFVQYDQQTNRLIYTQQNEMDDEFDDIGRIIKSMDFKVETMYASNVLIEIIFCGKCLKRFIFPIITEFFFILTYFCCSIHSSAILRFKSNDRSSLS